MSRRRDPKQLTETTCPACFQAVLTVTPDWPHRTILLDPTPLTPILEAACLILDRSTHAITGWHSPITSRWSHQRIDAAEPQQTRLDPHDTVIGIREIVLPEHACGSTLGSRDDFPAPKTIAELITDTERFLFTQCRECGGQYPDPAAFHAAHKEIHTTADPWSTRYACAGVLF